MTFQRFSDVGSSGRALARERFTWSEKWNEFGSESNLRRRQIWNRGIKELKKKKIGEYESRWEYKGKSHLQSAQNLRRWDVGSLLAVWARCASEMTQYLSLFMTFDSSLIADLELFWCVFVYSFLFCFASSLNRVCVAAAQQPNLRATVSRAIKQIPNIFGSHLPSPSEQANSELEWWWYRKIWNKFKWRGLCACVVLLLLFGASENCAIKVKGDSISTTKKKSSSSSEWRRFSCSPCIVFFILL